MYKKDLVGVVGCCTNVMSLHRCYDDKGQSLAANSVIEIFTPDCKQIIMTQLLKLFGPAGNGDSVAFVTELGNQYGVYLMSNLCNCCSH